VGVAALGVLVGLSMLLAPCEWTFRSEFTTNMLFLLMHGFHC
jgi:hypothetical protein